MRRLGQKYFSEKAASLVEVLVAIGILMVVFIGSLQVFIYCSKLSDLSRNMSWTMAEVQTKFEEIRNHNYSDAAVDYSSGQVPGDTFDLAQIAGKGIIYIDSSNADLLSVEIVATWRNPSGRIMGEDTNLNGVLDFGEDKNGNGKIDSVVKLVSLIARR